MATFFDTPAAFRAWLAENHETETELHVGFWKKATGRPSLTWVESVREALCFGWIDGVRRTIDADSYSIRFTPRKKDSHWSAVNVKHVGELMEAGLMAPAGIAAWEARTEENTAKASFEQRAEPELSPERAAEFRSHPGAWEFFQAQAPWYRRQSTYWVISAKKPETRARRLAQLIEVSAARKRR